MKYVIIGNSGGAIGAVIGIREYDEDGEILLISDEDYHTYSRPLISYWLEGKITEEKMHYRDPNFYERMNVDTILGRRVSSIDKDVKAITLDDGSTYSYDKLLVATGSSPFIPPIKGIDNVDRRFTFTKFDDAKAISANVKSGERILILGAGLIGLKAAEALYPRDVDLTVVDLSNKILSSILDENASKIVGNHIKKKDLSLVLDTSVDEFDGNKAILSNGEIIEFDVLIVSVGVRPNISLVQDIDGECRRGIITNIRQQTSIPDIYAAGDCTESHDISSGTDKIIALLPNAFIQGEVAGKNMAGGDAKYENAIPMNAIGFFGLFTITAGIYDGDGCISQINGEGNQYERLCFKDGRLKGFILVGNVANATSYTAIIKAGIKIADDEIELLRTNPNSLLKKQIR